MKYLFCCVFVAGMVLAALLVATEKTAPGAAPAESWEASKAAQIPKNEMPSRFGAPYRQPVATLAWEDGVYIARDGLTLYADYMPADWLKALFDKAFPTKAHTYRRGPEIGQDFSNPLGQSFPWLHFDIAYATRASTSEPFSDWRLTERRGRFFNQAGPQGIPNRKDKNRFDFFVYTIDTKSHVAIMLLRDTDRGLAGEGKELPDNVNNPHYNEDNPHLERVDDTDPRKLVLFFDSDNWPGVGGRDIWYTRSDDAGERWSDPKPVKSVNTKADEEQPHLYREGAYWWLYYTGSNPRDGKLAIYRVRQGARNNWERWIDKQVVVSAGTAQAVGEPTLTTNGDVSFVVITRNDKGTATDQYDCDPWFMPRVRQGEKSGR